MPRLLLRFVAIFLIPCLLLDPVLAAAFSTQSPAWGFTPTKTEMLPGLFSDQALTLKVASVPTRRLHDSASQLWSKAAVLWRGIRTSEGPKNVPQNARAGLEATGLLASGIQYITKATYEQIRRTGLQADRVSMSLCPDRYFVSRALDLLGPAGKRVGGFSENVAFVIDVTYVNSHAEAFELVGSNFTEAGDRLAYHLGLNRLGLSTAKATPDSNAKPDEIQTQSLPKEALFAMIIDAKMEHVIRQWDNELGLTPLPHYVLRDTPASVLTPINASNKWISIALWGLVVGISIYAFALTIGEVTFASDLGAIPGAAMILLQNGKVSPFALAASLGLIGMIGSSDQHSLGSKKARSEEITHYQTVIDWVKYVLSNYETRFGGNVLVFIGGSSYRGYQAARFLAPQFGIQTEKIIYIDVPTKVLSRMGSEQVRELLEQSGAFKHEGSITLLDHMDNTGNTLRRLEEAIGQQPGPFPVSTYLLFGREGSAFNRDVPGYNEAISQAAIFLRPNNWLGFEARRRTLISYERVDGKLSPIYLEYQELAAVLQEIGMDQNLFNLDETKLSPLVRKVLPRVRSYLVSRWFHPGTHKPAELMKPLLDLLAENPAETADRQDALFSSMLQQESASLQSESDNVPRSDSGIDETTRTQIRNVMTFVSRDLPEHFFHPTDPEIRLLAGEYQTLGPERLGGILRAIIDSDFDPFQAAIDDKRLSDEALFQAFVMQLTNPDEAHHLFLGPVSNLGMAKAIRPRTDLSDAIQINKQAYALLLAILHASQAVDGTGAIKAAKKGEVTGPTSTADLSPAPSQPPQKPVIIIAEDDKAYRELIIPNILKEGFSETHEFILATDGFEALKLFKELQAAGRQVDLLVTDLDMPARGDGNLLAERVLQLASDLPIIFETSGPRRVSESLTMRSNVSVIDKEDLSDDNNPLLRLAQKSINRRTADPDDTPGLTKDLGTFVLMAFATFGVSLVIGAIIYYRPQWLRAAQQAVTRALKNLFLKPSDIAMAFARAA